MVEKEEDCGIWGGKAVEEEASCFPSVCHEVMGPDAMTFVFLMLSFKPAFSLSSFTLVKSLVPLYFLPLEWYPPAVLIPVYDSSSLAFHMMCVHVCVCAHVCVC